MAILHKVKEIVAESIDNKIDTDYIRPEDNLIDDLGVDSLSMFFIYTKLEREFGVEIPEFPNLNITVSTLSKCVEERVAKKQITSMFIAIPEYERMLKNLKNGVKKVTKENAGH